jgi:hypothetical protein
MERKHVSFIPFYRIALARYLSIAEQYVWDFNYGVLDNICTRNILSFFKTSIQNNAISIPKKFYKIFILKNVKIYPYTLPQPFIGCILPFISSLFQCFDLLKDKLTVVF